MTIGEVLAPVRERYADWLGLDEGAVVEDRHEDPGEVRAIQLVLRMERDGSPVHEHALALAATGCALLCLDPRSATGGEWHEAVAAYGGVHIRKVTRRARGAQWQATADLPGLTLTDDAGDGQARTEIRVLVPGLVTDLDKRVAKLQVGGTDLPRGEAADRPRTRLRASAPELICTVPAALGMTTGKLMAQAGHAGMLAAALAAGTDPDLLQRWYDAGCPARVVTTDAETWAVLGASIADPATAWRSHHRLAVRDAGYTEVDPGTVTVIAQLEDG